MISWVGSPFLHFHPSRLSLLSSHFPFHFFLFLFSPLFLCLRSLVILDSLYMCVCVLCITRHRCLHPIIKFYKTLYFLDRVRSTVLIRSINKALLIEEKTVSSSLLSDIFSLFKMPTSSLYWDLDTLEDTWHKCNYLGMLLSGALLFTVVKICLSPFLDTLFEFLEQLIVESWLQKRMSIWSFQKCICEL